MWSALSARATPLLKRVIAAVTTTSAEAYHSRWYYSNRWHPRHALQQDALDETVQYIKANMPDAISRRDAFEVLSYGLGHAPGAGLHLEFGVHSGQTINHLAQRRPRTTFHGFDSFEGLPEPWSGYSLPAGAFRRRGLPEVRDNVVLVPGWFDETLPAFLADHEGAVAFVHVDSDLYSSARTVLAALAPRFRPGSVIVFNEYFNYPGWTRHEYRAFREFCQEHDVEYEYLCWGMYEVAVRLRSIGGEAVGGTGNPQ